MDSEKELKDILKEEKFGQLRLILGETNQSQMGIIMNGLLSSTKQIKDSTKNLKPIGHNWLLIINYLLFSF